MFSKIAEPIGAAQPVARPDVSFAAPNATGSAVGSNTAPSILGADLRVTGEITTTGLVEVLGEVDGTLNAASLIIGQEGRIKATVRAGTVEIIGTLDGKLICDSLTLRATAVVKAHITTDVIVIESGALIDGRLVKPKH